MIRSAYCGFLEDEEKLRQSASGGLAAAMAEYMISEGNVVYGAAYSSDFQSAEYIRVTDPEGTERLKGSKYVKAKVSRSVLESLARDLAAHSSVLFIGLPCDVHAAVSYLQKNNADTRRLMCVDLICQGTLPPRAAQEYIAMLEKKAKSRLVQFSVRRKNPFWTPPYLYAEFQNGRRYTEPFHNTEYGIAFRMMTEAACSLCRHKGENRRSDITIGDYWGAGSGDAGYSPYGSSIAFVHTAEGEEFLHSLRGFRLCTADAEKALQANPRYLSPPPPTAQREKFRRDFEKRGLRYAAARYLGFWEMRRRSLRNTRDFLRNKSKSGGKPD